jgi:hypothetical protein
MRHALDAGETPLSIPYAFGAVLSPANQTEDTMIVSSIVDTVKAVQTLVVYGDRGLTPSMLRELRFASQLPTEVRFLQGIITRCTSKFQNLQCKLTAGHPGPHLSVGPSKRHVLWT